jgi:hypothetical protein
LLIFLQLIVALDHMHILIIQNGRGRPLNGSYTLIGGRGWLGCFGCVQTPELEVGDVGTGWGCESQSKYASLSRICSFATTELSCIVGMEM